MSDFLERAVEECLECFAVCEETIEYCLANSFDGDRSLVQTLVTCAAMCDAAAYFSRDNAALRREALTFCAEINDRSAARCEEYRGDVQLAACARACRGCATACRRALLSLVP